MRFDAVLKFRSQYNPYWDDMLSYIVTGDKTWISHILASSK